MLLTDFFNIQTPALLFPAVSLLMLAYTNRFFGITSVIRKLHADMSRDTNNHGFYFAQIQSLSERIKLIIWAQKTGILSLISCVLSMIAIFFNHNSSLGLFAMALCFMSVSLIFIFKELSLSQEALAYILNDCAKINNELNKQVN
jgi:hypothetical protein